MSLNPYDYCSCGSGKKFKWCCHGMLERADEALAQFNNGQPELAVQTMSKVVQDFPQNPQSWGRLAQLQFAHGQVEAAENSLDEGFKLNPQYAFGFLLRGLFRLQENEPVGALMLFRKAIEAFHPETHDQLAFLFSQVAELELRRNALIAGVFAYKEALKHNPDDEEMKMSFVQFMNDNSRSPIFVRGGMKLRELVPPVEAYAKIPELLANYKFSQALTDCKQLAESQATNADLWYNAGLIAAYQGDHPTAFHCFRESTQCSTDDVRAADAWAYAEVVKMASGMHQESDYSVHTVGFRIRDPQAVSKLLEEWQNEGRLGGVQGTEDGMMVSGLIFESHSAILGAAPPKVRRAAAHFLIVQDLFQIWHPNPKSIENLRAELTQRVGLAVGEARETRGPGQFGDTVIEALFYPSRPNSPLETQELLRTLVEKATAFFVDEWPTRPLRSLNGKTPLQAVSDPDLRKRLLGILRLLEDAVLCSSPAVRQGESVKYVNLVDFAKVQAKLGLLDNSAEESAAVDVSTMNADQLKALDPATLSEETLGNAFRTALGLGERELASTLAAVRVSRSVPGDTYPFFNHLISMAVEARDWELALSRITAAVESDAVHNEGKRKDDYDLRRGQLLLKKGDADTAKQVFTDLIARNPNEVRYCISAAEAMLSARQAGSAKSFAETGLNKARELNNRDAEGHLQELLAAASR